MKTITLLMAFIMSCTYSYGQLISNTIYPSATPTEADTIEAYLVLELPDGDNSQSNSLTISNDTILYKSCYYNGSTLSEVDVYDTVLLGSLSVGIYKFIIEVKITEENTDNYCELPDVLTLTYDTIITVSKYTGIHKANSNTLQAVLINANSPKVQAAQNGIANIEVLDATGRLCYTVKQEVHTGKNIIDMDIPSQSTGIYFYHIRIGEQRAVLKFVKQ